MSEAPKIKKGRESIEGLHGRMETLIRNISGNYNLEVTSKLPPDLEMKMKLEGKELHDVWMRVVQIDQRTGKPKHEYVFVPPNIFESSEEIALSKAAHEASHVAITRREHFREEVPTVPGYAAIDAALEERPTDQYVREVAPGIGRWLDKARQEQLVEAEDGADSGNVSKPPRFLQLANQIVFDPVFTDKQKKEQLDPEVLAVYEEIRSAVEQVEHTLPSEDSSETERIALARERAKILRENIWPKVEALAEEDRDDEAARQFANHILREVMSGEHDEILREILKMLSEHVKHMSEQDSSEQEPVEPKTPEDSEQIKSLDELSPELQEKLKEVLSEQPADIRKDMEERGDKSLKEQEQKLVKEMASDLVPEPPEADDSKDETSREEIEKEIADASEALEARLAAESKEKSRYDTVFGEMFNEQEQLYRHLEDIFYPNVKSAIRLASAGSTVNLPALFRWESAKAAGSQSLNNKVFERRNFPEVRDYAFTLLIDLSGSMHGEKIKEAFKGAVMLTEALNRVGVTCEVLGFQDELIVFKSADEDMSDVVRARMAGMELEVEGTNPGGNNENGGNDDGLCLREASDRLTKQSQRVKFISVISDGMPNSIRNREGGLYGGVGHRAKGQEELHATVQHILQDTDHHLLGLGLGGGTEHVTKFYPNAIPNIDAKDFPEVLAKVLIDTMENPDQY